MLKTRLITAAILVPLVVAGVLLLPNDVFALVLGLVMVPAIFEWARLVPLHSLLARAAFGVVIVLSAWLLWTRGLHVHIDSLLLLAFGWWLWVLFWLSRPAMLSGEGYASRGIKSAAGVLLIVSTWASLTVLHATDRGEWLVLMLLVIVWLADSGAYFAGRAWGRNKLAPHVSPGKTWEGVYGGAAAGVFFAAVAGWFYSRTLEGCFMFALVALLVVLFSVAGDLLESLMKRHRGVKDSGTLVPGHGGMLDRIDSLLAAAPLFLMGLDWFGVVLL